MKTSDRKPQPFTPLTGESCSCRPGIQRDNCPSCEGTGNRIDFAAIHRERDRRQAEEAPCDGEGPHWGEVVRVPHFPGSQGASMLCAACRTKYAAEGEGQVEPPSAYVRRMRAAFGDDFALIRRRVEVGGSVFIITKHVTRSGARVFLPVVFYRSPCDPPAVLAGMAEGETPAVPARDAFRIGKRECVALGWRWDKKHLGWVEEIGGGQTALMAIRELSRVLFNDPSSLVAVEV